MVLNSGLTSYEKIIFFQQFIIFNHCFLHTFLKVFTSKKIVTCSDWQMGCTIDSLSCKLSKTAIDISSFKFNTNLWRNANCWNLLETQVISVKKSFGFGVRESGSLETVWLYVRTIPVTMLIMYEGHFSFPEHFFFVGMGTLI